MSYLRETVTVTNRAVFVFALALQCCLHFTGAHKPLHNSCSFALCEHWFEWNQWPWGLKLSTVFLKCQSGACLCSCTRILPKCTKTNRATDNRLWFCKALTQNSFRSDERSRFTFRTFHFAYPEIGWLDCAECGENSSHGKRDRVCVKSRRGVISAVWTDSNSLIIFYNIPDRWNSDRPASKTNNRELLLRFKHHQTFQTKKISVCPKPKRKFVRCFSLNGISVIKGLASSFSSGLVGTLWCKLINAVHWCTVNPWIPFYSILPAKFHAQVLLPKFSIAGNPAWNGFQCTARFPAHLFPL